MTELGCETEAAGGLEVVVGWELKRCPNATLFSAESDDIVHLHHEGYLQGLSAMERRRAPAKLIQALEWVDEVWRDHKRRTEGKD